MSIRSGIDNFSLLKARQVEFFSNIYKFSKNEIQHIKNKIERPTCRRKQVVKHCTALAESKIPEKPQLIASINQASVQPSINHRRQWQAGKAYRCLLLSISRFYRTVLHSYYAYCKLSHRCCAVKEKHADANKHSSLRSVLDSSDGVQTKVNESFFSPPYFDVHFAA